MAAPNRHERRAQRKAARSGAVDEQALGVLQQEASELFEKGRFKEARRVCQRILKAMPDRADVHGFLGLIGIRLRDWDNAVASYKEAVRLRPDYVEAWYNLGNACRGAGREGEAADAYERALALRGDLAPAHQNLANALVAMERYEAAVPHYERVRELAPDHGEAHRGLGIALEKLGRADEAMAAYRAAIDAAPDDFQPYTNLCRLLLQAGRPEEVLAVTERWLERIPGHIEALSFRSLAANEAGDRALADFLFDFDRFVIPRMIETPPGYGSIEAFNEALAAQVYAERTLAVPPEDDPRNHGPLLAITEELLDRPKGALAAFRGVIEKAIAEYRRLVPEQPPHPFLADWPPDYRLDCWATLLRGQGNLMTHIHLSGYLSGVYYPLLPDVVDDKEAGEAGWLEVGRAPDDLNCQAPQAVHTIQPRPGLLVLFPAYYYHRTIPFESRDHRISVAFDMVPVRD